MQFLGGGNDIRCGDCAFIQAVGPITPTTPADFEAFLARERYTPKRVRLHSPGGNLAAGIALGELLRAKGFSTEVGNDRLDTAGNVPAVGGRASERVPGECASACAYAFLGGVERRLDTNSRLGFHRFYRQSAIQNPTATLFTGHDLDEAQKLTAALVLYVVRMGVDGRVVSLAAEAGPSEMRWINSDEARTLGVAHEPRKWRPWRIETFRGGVLAISETNDLRTKMVISCSRRNGPQLVLTDTIPPPREPSPLGDFAAWFEQNRNCVDDAGHPVLGARVHPSRVEVIRMGEHTAAIRFRLPNSNPPLTSPAIFDRAGTSYPNACSTYEYQGALENFVPAARVALRNCFSD